MINTYKSESDACNETSVCQYGGSCWYVTTFMMFAKIKELYNLIKPAHQKFVDELLLCPKDKMEFLLQNAPIDIWKLYKEKHVSDESVMAHGKNNNVNINELFEKGGYTNILFKTMMELNNIYYLNNYHNYLITYTSWKNLTTYIADKLDKTSEACKLLMDPKIYNQKYLSNNVDLYD